MQRPGFGLRRPQPLDRRPPLRMRSEILVAITGDPLAEQFDLAAGRLKRVSLRIGAERVKKYELLGRRGQFDIAPAPKILKLGPGDAGAPLRRIADRYLRSRPARRGFR